MSMILFLQGLYAITEGVADVEGFITRERQIVVSLDAGELEASVEFGEIIDEKGWMSFPGRMKAGFSTKIEADGFGLEPAAAPCRQVKRLLNLGQPE